MIQGVIFDMDGLMFDTERVSMRVWGEQLAKFGWSFCAQQGRAIRGCNDEGICRALTQVYGPQFQYVPVRDGVRAQLAQVLEEEGVPVKEGLLPLLAWLKQQGISCAVASSSRHVTVEHHCQSAGVREYFDHLVCGDMVEHSKPHPEIFLKAAELLGVSPRHCLVLEDSYNGVRAGAAGGFVTVMVPDMDPPTPEMESLYTACAPSLLTVRDWLKNGTL